MTINFFLGNEPLAASIKMAELLLRLDPFWYMDLVAEESFRRVAFGHAIRA